MTQKKESKTNKRRTQIKELPKEEKQLSKGEQKKIKGGHLLHNIMDGVKTNPKQ